MRMRNRAFARVDCLCVVAVVALLGGLQLTTLGNGRVLSQQAACLTHIKQLGRAWQMYATSNDEKLPAAGRYSDVDQPPDWTTGSADSYTASGEWLDLPPQDEADINPEHSIIDHNKLWPYVESVEAFRCPSDTSYGSHPDYRDGKISPRVRSYSMNNWMGGPSWGGGPWNVFKSLSEIVAPSPADVFVLIGEREDSINDGTFMVDMAGWNGDSADQKIVDFPQFKHNGGANLVFADGHAEYWQWQDQRTVPSFTPNEEIQLNRRSPANPDVTRIQSVSTRTD